jgi:CheY-like chemotaxis protein
LLPKVTLVTSRYKILIADRNRHVRDFLRRELTAEGYRVEVAADGREILSRINGADPPHLLILDLEIPYLDDAVWYRLQDCQPPLPLVIHTLLPQHPTNQTFPFAAAFLEKAGDTDLLKTVVAEVIGKYYPQGLPAREQHG